MVKGRGGGDQMLGPGLGISSGDESRDWTTIPSMSTRSSTYSKVKSSCPTFLVRRKEDHRFPNESVRESELGRVHYRSEAVAAAVLFR